MNGNIKIYGLFDETGCRYIGKTKQSLDQRLYGHMSVSELKSSTYKNNWLKTLITRGVEPEIRLLELTDENNWKWRERVWISFGKNVGWKLTNLKEGGEGGGIKGHTVSEETRKKIGNANKGRRTGLFGNKRSLGHKHSKETRERISMVGKGRHNLNEAARERIRQSRLGKIVSAETKKKLSVFFLGKNGKPVEQLSLSSGDVLATYPSTRQAALISTGKSSNISTISKCCNGKLKSCMGYQWRYKLQEEAK